MYSIKATVAPNLAGTVNTIMDTNFSVSTIIKICLISSAAHIIQEDKSSSRTKDVPISDCYCFCKLCNKSEVIQLASIYP